MWRLSNTRVKIFLAEYAQQTGKKLPWFGSTDRLEDEVDPVIQRCYEIRSYADEMFSENPGLTTWVALDDLVLNATITAEGGLNDAVLEDRCFVRCDPEVGLTPDLVNECVAKLTGGAAAAAGE